MTQSISLILCAVAVLSTNARGQDSPKPKAPAPAKPVVFEVEDHKAYVYAAPKPAEGKPWIWYSPTIRGSVLIANHKVYFDAFMEAGLAVAGYDLGEVRGAPESTAKFTLFYDAMVKQGYSTKPILLGQSRGGLMSLAWAIQNPTKLQAWVGIYPVCNLTSWPLKSSKKETLADYNRTEEQLIAQLKELNPIENLAGLAKQKVPFFAVHGDKDGPVPYDENTKKLKENYEAVGGTCTVKVILGAGHAEIPAFFECRELLEFVYANAPRPGGKTMVRDGMVTVEPPEFTGAINNPLKGFRDYKPDGYGLLKRTYIKWSDIEVGAGDTVDRIIAHTN
ncbi:MAG: alpha/beta hydrolase family protein, partial [Gemmataceae bacterium]